MSVLLAIYPGCILCLLYVIMFITLYAKEYFNVLSLVELKGAIAGKRYYDLFAVTIIWLITLNASLTFIIPLISILIN